MMELYFLIVTPFAIIGLWALIQTLFGDNQCQL